MMLDLLVVAAAAGTAGYALRLAEERVEREELRQMRRQLQLLPEAKGEEAGGEEEGMGMESVEVEVEVGSAESLWQPTEEEKAAGLGAWDVNPGAVEVPSVSRVPWRRADEPRQWEGVRGKWRGVGTASEVVLEPLEEAALRASLRQLHHAHQRRREAREERARERSRRKAAYAHSTS